DASVMELLMAYGAGAALILSPANPVAGEALSSLMIDRGVTHALITPAALAGATPAALEDFETLIVGGEACPPDLVAAWAGGRRMINAYGPTEATVCATMSDPLPAPGRRAGEDPGLPHRAGRGGSGPAVLRGGGPGGGGRPGGPGGRQTPGGLRRGLPGGGPGRRGAAQRASGGPGRLHGARRLRGHGVPAPHPQR